MDEDFSNKGLYLLLKDMDERHEKKLDQIETQVRLTNGRTTKLEERVDGIKSELRTLKHHHAVPPTPPALPAVEQGESFSVKISAKLWVAIAAAGGMLFPALIKWLGTLLP